ncbi:MAG: hypothetical protein U5K84_13190 [Alkalibacterium sp.]|nr:hypothetical protein [Alkalibacterium sp.]
MSGENFDAFMAIELTEKGLKDIKGKVSISSVFENIPEEKVEEYNKHFPALQKMKFPDQWQ